MEKQRNLDAADAGSLHLAALSRQNLSDIARDLGGLDSVDGDYLFAAARAPISVVRTGAFVLGLAPDLHYESFRRKSGSRRAPCLVHRHRKLSTDYRTLIPRRFKNP